jgi:hypothetical protein
MLLLERSVRRAEKTAGPNDISGHADTRPPTTNELIMAKTDRKWKARDMAPVEDKHLNPLGRIHSMLSESHGSRRRAEAVLAMHCTGIYALVRLLGNSEAFRDVQANCESVEPGHWPLNGQITDGLFTALLMLSARAEELSQSLPEKGGRGRIDATSE